MNNVYTHNYKEVEVMDDKGNIRKVDYSDNTGEILECENAIETLECQIEETKDYLNKNYKYGSVNKLKLYIPTIINVLGTAASFSLVYVSFKLGGTPYCIFPGVAGFVGVGCFLGTSASLFMDRYQGHKFYKGEEARLYALEQYLIVKKTKLQELLNDKSVTSCDNAKVGLKKVDNTELKQMNNICNLVSHYGYEGEKIVKSYEQGNFNSEIEKYDAVDATIVKNYFEERVKVLSKKKDRKI